MKIKTVAERKVLEGREVQDGREMESNENGIKEDQGSMSFIHQNK